MHKNSKMAPCEKNRQCACAGADRISSIQKLYHVGEKSSGVISGEDFFLEKITFVCMYVQAMYLVSYANYNWLIVTI